MGSGEQQIGKGKHVKSSYKIVCSIFMLEAKGRFKFSLKLFVKIHILQYFSIRAQEMDAYTDRKIYVHISVRFVVDGAIPCVLFNLQCSVSMLQCAMYSSTLYIVE